MAPPQKFTKVSLRSLSSATEGAHPIFGALEYRMGHLTEQINQELVSKGNAVRLI